MEWKILLSKAAPCHKQLYARVPSLEFRVRVSNTPCGFRGGRNGVWVDLYQGFSCFSLPQISFHHFSTRRDASITGTCSPRSAIPSWALPPMWYVRIVGTTSLEIYIVEVWASIVVEIGVSSPISL